MSREHIDAAACRDLWTAVLTLAIADLAAKGDTLEARHRRASAHAWLRSSTEMLTVAALAGLDGRMIRQRFLAGKLRPDLLNGARQVHKAIHSAA